jgi:glycosyltransferase involved in cell wall biosynthesis
MKHIVLVLGTGLNERGWARDFSKFAKVTLIQIGLVEHIEVWQNQEQTYNGPEVKKARVRRWDDMLFGLLSFWRTLQFLSRVSREGKIDLVITGFYSSGIAALLLRAVGKIKKTTFFLTDYLPPSGGGWLVRIHRWVTYRLLYQAATRANEAWALSPRIKDFIENKNQFVVPMQIGLRPASNHKREEIGYIGNPSYDHALDLLFEICGKNSLRLNIIGDSPYLASIKHLAPPQTVFHGIQNDEKVIGDIFGRCFCGYAIYRNTGPTSYSYYGFPSKALYCFASNVPIVITNVAYFNETFEKEGVGRVVKPAPAEIEKAILQLRDNYDQYSRAIDRFRAEWNAKVDLFHRQRLDVLLN